MSARPLPPVSELGYEQSSGRACCRCGILLTKGAVYAGIARGQLGAHVLDAHVFECPDCSKESPADGAPPCRSRDEGGPPQ